MVNSYTIKINNEDIVFNQIVEKFIGYTGSYFKDKDSKYFNMKDIIKWIKTNIHDKQTCVKVRW